jgi:hypothetical protein
VHHHTWLVFEFYLSWSRTTSSYLCLLSR